MRWLVIVVILASAQAHAEDVLVPAEGDGRPLLVLMHGDDQPTADMVAPFRELAKKKNIALFAPQCPAKLGCDTSWWRWNGEPVWLNKAVDKAIRDGKVDDKRVWILGWSGGAAYVGYHLAALQPRYAAIVFVGGGSPGGRCAKPKGLPILTISGDKNPHHDLMQITHARYLECGHAVTWKLLKGKDHDDEWRFLVQSETLATVFDFLEEHPRK